MRSEDELMDDRAEMIDRTIFDVIWNVVDAAGDTLVAWAQASAAVADAVSERAKSSVRWRAKREAILEQALGMMGEFAQHLKVSVGTVPLPYKSPEAS